MTMICFIFLVLCFFVSLASGDVIAAHYWELGCTPSILKEDVPQLQRRYNCSILDNIKPDQCYHGGKLYSIGSKLSRYEMDGCTPECECVKESAVGADWKCQPYSCEGIEDGNIPDCIVSVLYDPENTCCKKKYECDKDKKIEGKQVVTCEFNGKVYMLGEKIFLPFEKCVDCVCVEGFDAKNFSGPGCKPKYCRNFLDNSSNLKKGCVPMLYDLGLCCPGVAGWRCPDEENLTVLESTLDPEEKEKNKDLKCKFGKWELEIGQRVTKTEKGDECTVCNCTTPPHLTCIHDFGCSTSKFGVAID